MKTFDPVQMATPFFMLAVILEIVLARMGKANARYEAKDTAVVAGHGPGQQHRRRPPGRGDLRRHRLGLAAPRSSRSR